MTIVSNESLVNLVNLPIFPKLIIFADIEDEICKTLCYLTDFYADLPNICCLQYLIRLHLSWLKCK